MNTPGHTIGEGQSCALDHHASKRVRWIELFFDLVFVAAVGQVGRPLTADAGPADLLRYVTLLVVIWWAWHGYAAYATRFDPDTAAARTCTLLQMVAVVFMAANAEEGLASTSTAGFMAAYGVLRALLALQYALTPAAKGDPPSDIRTLLVASVVWIGSALVPVPWRYVCWLGAAGVEILRERALRQRVLLAPPHVDHFPERFGLFTLILLGEALVAIMHGVQQQPAWRLPAVTVVTAGLTVVGLVWWVYFDVARATAPRPVITSEDVRTLARWTYLHLPLYLGVAMLGVEVEHLIADGGHGVADPWRLGRVAGALATIAVSLALLRHTASPSLQDAAVRAVAAPASVDALLHARPQP